MFRAFKDLLDSLAAPVPTARGASPAHELALATAVLLVEVMRAEPTLGEAERVAVADGLRAHFPLADDELAALVALAHDTARTASDFHQFTSRLNARFSTEDKIRMVESMWRVAYADGHLDAHENHLISRVAQLLHVTHGQYIAAKLRAKEAAPPA